MNIFVLDNCPRESARMMADKHVVKMPTESLQMISTILNLYGLKSPYKPVMLNHPCTIWSRETKQNMQFLLDHADELCKEYTRRYGKVHKVELSMKEFAKEIEKVLTLLPDDGLTPFAVAISENQKCRSAVENFDSLTTVEKYRAYYIHDKYWFATWRWPLNPPSWYAKHVNQYARF